MAFKAGDRVRLKPGQSWYSIEPNRIYIVKIYPDTGRPYIPIQADDSGYYVDNNLVEVLELVRTRNLPDWF